MARQATPKQEIDQTEQFPILFQGKGLRIYKNPRDEVFVEEIDSGVTMRCNARHGGIEFTTDGRVEPIQVSSLIGWRVFQR